MKKIVCILLVAIMLTGMVSAEAEAIDAFDAYVSNAEGEIEGFYYLWKIMAEKGIPNPNGDYFSTEPVTGEHASAVLSWLFAEDLMYTGMFTKTRLVMILAEMLGLEGYQVESILPKRLLNGRLNVKNFNYCILCIIEHPLTASKVNSEQYKIKLYEEIYLTAKDSDECIIDMEMLEWFVPTYIELLGPKAVLEQVQNYLGNDRPYVIQNAKYVVKENSNKITILYTGAWMHIVAIRPDTQIFEQEYETKLLKFWNDSLKVCGIIGMPKQDASCILNYLVKLLEYDENKFDQTMIGVILGRKVVCAGYSDAFKFLANMRGIECVLATNLEEAQHQWVQIRDIENGEWLNIDPTWDDEGSDSLYKFFALTDCEYEMIGHPLPDSYF